MPQVALLEVPGARAGVTVPPEVILVAVGRAIVITAPDGTIVSWNAEAERMYGWAAEDVLGKGLIDVTNPELAPQDDAAEIMSQLMAGRTWSGEIVVQRRDGTRFPALVVDTPVFEDGELAAIIAVSSDMSDWRRLEAANEQLAHRYQLGFERAVQPVSIVDLDGLFVDVNPALCSFLGLPAASIVGHKPDEFILSRSGPTASEQVSAALAGADGELGGEASFRCADGSVAWALVNVALVRDASGSPQYFFVQMRDITGRKSADDALLAANRRLESALNGVVLATARTVELRDPYTAGHQARVAMFAVAIATELELDADEVEGIRVAASLHDIGKVAIPAEVLAYPGRLSAAQFELIKEHPQHGHDVLDGIDFPWPVARMILEHHERIDGSGYPNGRVGTEILLGSRIIAVADVVEAISAHRPYRPALGMDAALATIREGAGTLFDATVVDACLRVMDRSGASFSGPPAA